MTVRYRRLEENNEPAMGRGLQDFISNAEAVGQAVITRLRLFRGEWWENEYLGIPLWQSMLGVVARKEAIDRIIQDCILETEGVSSIDDLTSVFDPQTRSYKFYCSINTIYGITVITNQEQGVITR
jgi:hypothetical protein